MRSNSDNLGRYYFVRELAALVLLLMLQIPGTFPQAVPYTYPPNYVFEDGETFEYVVVGAGAAGSAAAARLALAGAAGDVLLVEAGGDPSPLAAIPSAAMGLLGSSIDWKYETIPNDKSCLSSIGRACRFARGKCLGGSTSINYMMYTRGNRLDYDSLGVPGWTWDDLKPYFLRYEGFQDINRLPRSSLPYHNTSGILKVGFFDDPENPWHSKLVEGFQSLGFEHNPDVNAATQIGVSTVAGYVYRGQRMSTARGYLARDPVKSRLKVAKDTTCTGLMIDDNNVTIGITVVRGPLKTPLRIYARKEVILSAGAIGTPQILMLSGIGHADHLREVGIPVRADLPVGDNMSDHVMPLIYLTVDRHVPSLASNLVDLFQLFDDLGEFLVKKSGPFATNNIGDINTFINSRCYLEGRQQAGLANGTGRGCELPTVQFSQQYLNKGLLTIGKSIFQKSTSLNDNVIDQLAAANEEHAIIHVLAAVLRPFSRGTVRLASADPLARPAIFANYFGDSRDVDEAVRAIQIIEDLVESPIFRRHNASLIRLDFPDCPRKKTGSVYWSCYVRHMTSSVYHAVGTCGMPDVVDERLRVRRVGSVRVADISVLPEIPRGNTEAIALAIGEKVVDLVREDNARHGLKEPTVTR